MCVRFTTHHWLFLNPPFQRQKRRGMEWVERRYCKIIEAFQGVHSVGLIR